jgi:hypothetical protein
MTDDELCGDAMTADADRALSPVPLMQLATGFWAFKTLAAAAWRGGRDRVLSRSSVVNSNEPWR